MPVCRTQINLVSGLSKEPFSRLEYVDDLRRGDGVEVLPTFTARDYESAVTETRNVLGDRGLGKAQRIGEISDPRFALAQSSQYRKATGVGERVEQRHGGR